MKLLLAFTILISLCAATKKFGAHPHVNETEPDTLRKGSHFTKVLPSSSEKRFQRDTFDEKVKDSLQKMEMISLVTNVIYIQQGLSNGSFFDTEELISELLQIAPVTPWKIHNIDYNQITEAFNAMKELPSKLQNNDYVADFERVFSIIETIQENIKGLSEIEKWDGKDVFAADLQKIMAGKVDLIFVDEIKRTFSDWDTDYTRILPLSSKTGFEVGDFSLIKYLKESSSAMKSVKKKLEKNSKPFFQFTNGKKAVDAINPLVRISRSVEILKKGILPLSDKSFELFNNNAKKIIGAVRQMERARRDLDIVRNIFISRLHPTMYPYTQYTHGLPGGYDDITELARVFNNDWFKTVARSGILQYSYPSFRSLAPNMNMIQKSLGIQREKEIESLLHVMTESEKLYSFFSGLQEDDVRRVADCFKNNKRGANSSIVQEFKSLVEEIDKEFKRLSNRLKGAREVLESEEKNLDSLIELLETAEKGNVSTYSSTIQKFSTFHASSTIYNSFNEPIFETLNDIRLKNLANTTAIKLNEINDYETDVAKYYPLLDCLLKNKEAPKVINAVKSSEILRNASENNGDKYEDGLRLVEKVVDTKKHLTSVQNVMNEAKGYKSFESDLLNLLKKAKEHSKYIGMSTKGVAAVKVLIDRMTEFRIFKIHSKLVKDQVNKYSKIFNAEELKLLEDLVSLDDSINKTFTGLLKWKLKVNSLEFSTLKSYSELFPLAKDLPGLPSDLSNMAQVLQKLIDSIEADDETRTKRSTATDTLRQVKDALISLDSLQFSKYIYKSYEVKGSLSALEKFFTEYSAAEYYAKHPTNPPPSMETVPSTGIPVNNIPSFDIRTVMMIIFCFVSIIFSVFSCAGICCWT